MAETKKVVIGLSGGVDSAVGAYMLQKAGFHVEAIFMRNWDSSLNGDVLGNPNDPMDVCPQEKDYMDALAVANQLGIKLHRIDFVSEYWDKVFKYFIDEYASGRTPNPDILCNKEIKFKCFLEKAMEMDFDYIAMGHYARQENGILMRGVDDNKDQSYFLCQLSKAQIEKCLFPIGHLTKPEVRKIAEEIGIAVAKKKDSTGVCFIGERNFRPFLKNYIPAKAGKMMTLSGEIVGEHEGVMYYTIGQRHGLSIGGPGEAWFVVGKDVKNNILYVGQGKDQEYLYSNKCICSNINWLGPKKEGPIKCTAKFRYRQKDIDVTVEFIDEDKLVVKYPSLARAVTPGQAAVFYDGEIVLGGSTIDTVYMDDEVRLY